ncbi:MAG: PAS domain S-box protein [Acidobacteria bacterium]|nr:PAS domain S-box protein [Acidobacteriota bacterium]
MNLVTNLDLAFFYYGLAYVLMAAVCVSLRRDGRHNLPWEYLGLFGGLLGSVAWMNLIAISFGDSTPQLYLRLTLMASAFVCLVEFGRAGLHTPRRIAGRWIHIPLIILAASGALADVRILKITPRYALALPGAILAAVTLYRAARQAVGGKRLLQSTAAAMLLVALTSGLIGSPAALFPATVINQEAFLRLTGIPLPVVRSGVAILIAILLALYSAATGRSEGELLHRVKTAPFGTWLVPSLLVVLVLGWVATDVTGNRIEAILINDVREEARCVAVVVDPEDVSAIPPSVAGESSSAASRIRREVSRLREANHDIIALRIQHGNPDRTDSAADADVLASDVFGPQEYGEEVVGWSSAGGRSVGDGVEYFDKEGSEMVRVTVPLEAGIGSGRSGLTLVIDLDARGWSYLVYRARLGPLGTMLLLSLALIALALARERSRKDSSQMAESERRYRSLVEGSPDCVQLFDHQGRVLSTNQNGLAILGWDDAALRGRRYQDVWPEEARSAVEGAVERVVSGERAELEGDYARSDGRTICLSVVLNPILDAQGSVRYFVGISTDISERRRTEREKEKLEQQLRQAQRMESIGQLAGGVAHDFNNVLTAMMGYAELALARYDQKDYVREKLRGIIEAGERAGRLTRQLLAFSRKQVLEMSILNLNETVASMETMLRRLIGEDIRVQTFLPDGLPSVRADVAQLEQILMNLAVNARDAMPEGGMLTIETKKVHLDEAYARAHAGVTPGDHVMLAVSDTGCGMDPTTVSHVFEPFFTTKERGEGIGLGLATVYGIVRQHSGTIGVYSEPGIGSTFKIYLPADLGSPRPDAQMPPQTQSAASGTETVLVVEDDESVRILVAETLENYGYTVIKAADAIEAIRIAHSFPREIHLMVTDVIMPRMNGKELHQRMSVIRPLTKVIYISGYTDNVIAHHGILEAGINFLQKPISVQPLIQKVRDVLDE